MKQNNSLFVILSLALITFLGCQKNENQRLPILGFPKIIGEDTMSHKIPPFRFINQDSQWVTNQTFVQKIYIADFFFTSCPTICPKVKKQMMRIYTKYEGDTSIALLSHSVDTRRDSVPRLKRYAENLGVHSSRWHFVTGLKSEIYGIADEYLSIAKEDPNAPGGFDHSGRLILIDPKGQIRSYCNGTEEEDVTRFMEDIERLLHEVRSK